MLMLVTQFLAPALLRHMVEGTSMLVLLLVKELLVVQISISTGN
jgi:hypothetical protein